MKSLTFLICTRNGSASLPDCIAHIQRQKGIHHEECEVIVVDNGSTDNTAEVAQLALAKLQCETRFVVEAEEGKINALLRGLRLSQAPYVTIVDDDNMIGEEFALHTLRMFSEFDALGMVGSLNALDAQSIPPWFPSASGRYACAMPHLDGEIKTIDQYRTISSHGLIAGAGSTFRKEPLLRALALGFDFGNDTVRNGRTASGGEDLELCHLLHFCGYWFGFDRRVTLRHRINQDRLTWPYARRLSRGVGAAGIMLDAYIWLGGDAKQLQGTWWWLVGRRLLRLPRMIPKYLANRSRPSREVLTWDTELGALIRLFRERGDFTRRMQRMKSSRWAQQLRNSSFKKL